jgi:hypothetical protein
VSIVRSLFARRLATATRKDSQTDEKRQSIKEVTGDG